MAAFDAIIFDFDGVLLESEYEGNRLLAGLLTELGYKTSLEDAIDHYVGLSGPQFIGAIEKRIGEPLPDEFHNRRKQQSIRALEDGVRAVAGAVEFVRSLPSTLPKAVASSSSSRWLRGHLGHLGLSDAFGEHVYSGREHVERSKPAPDLYLHAAAQLGVPIERTLIIEDSRIGAIGAAASGGTVVGFTAGDHCNEAHGEMLLGAGVHHLASSFKEVGRLLQLS